MGLRTLRVNQYLSVDETLVMNLHKRLLGTIMVNNIGISFELVRQGDHKIWEIIDTYFGGSTKIGFCQVVSVPDHILFTPLNIGIII